MINFTPPYDYSKYNLPKCTEQTDLRHIFMIYHVLKNIDFKGGSMAELGVFNGDGSTAFIEMLNFGKEINQVWFCDTQFNSNFDKVIGHCKYPDKLFFKNGFSTELLVERAFNLVFIDTDHTLSNSQKEIALLMDQKCPNIFAHDTSSQNSGHRCCEGSAWIKAFLQAQSGYYCLEDNLKRDRERTDRGLFFATTSLDNYNVMKEAIRLFGF